jgi:hypothetical protein
VIVEKIEAKIETGVVIPKPKASADFKVKGWGTRRGERALIYQIPNHKTPGKPYQKGITVSEFEAAYRELQSSGEITRTWFKKNSQSAPKRAAETASGLISSTSKVSAA